MNKIKFSMNKIRYEKQTSPPPYTYGPTEKCKTHHKQNLTHAINSIWYRKLSGKYLSNANRLQSLKITSFARAILFCIWNSWFFVIFFLSFHLYFYKWFSSGGDNDAKLPYLFIFVDYTMYWCQNVTVVLCTVHTVHGTRLSPIKCVYQIGLPCSQ